MKRINLIVFGIVLLTSLMAYSSDLTPQRVQLIYKVAKQANIDPNDLIRIAYVESRFKVNAVRANSNGTIDYGMFQINSVHWDTTCKGINVMEFKGNVRCAAKLIQQAQLHSHNDKHWIGRYHSKTHSKKIFYSNLLQNIPKVLLTMTDK